MRGEWAGEGSTGVVVKNKRIYDGITKWLLIGYIMKSSVLGMRLKA